MGKVKATSEQKKASAIKNTQSIVKKRRKEKDEKGPLTNVRKNDLKRLNGVKKHICTICTNIQNIKKKKTHKKLENKHGMKDTKKPHTSKNNDKEQKIFQKMQTNTDNKEKHKKTNKKTKNNINWTNNTKQVIIKKGKNREMQHTKIQTQCEPTKKSIDSENIERKITNIEKLNIKKLKQIPTESKSTNTSKIQQVESPKILKCNNHRINIERLENMLTKVQTKKIAQIVPIPLKDRLMRMLRASRFRFINETLYTNESSHSNRYFKEDPDAFKAYHDGYKQQVEQWPVNPLDVIISHIKDTVPTNNVLADFGCGEARLASSVPHKVHSFDFIPLNDNVTACDMAHTPLLANSVHVVVFCLSLMGTNLNDYIREANRVLKNDGILKIAEVASRFEHENNFVKLLGSFGFKNTWTDFSHDLFYFMDFKKVADVSMKRKNLPEITLKSCLYKKR